MITCDEGAMSLCKIGTDKLRVLEIEPKRWVYV